MLYPESKKLDLIKSLINETNEDVLNTVEKILSGKSDFRPSKFRDFSNTLTEEELDAFEKNIENGCEQIDEHEWE